MDDDDIRCIFTFVIYLSTLTFDHIYCVSYTCYYGVMIFGNVILYLCSVGILTAD